MKDCIGYEWTYNDVIFKIIGHDNYLSCNKYKVLANNTVMYVNYRDIVNLDKESLYNLYLKRYPRI